MKYLFFLTTIFTVSMIYSPISVNEYENTTEQAKAVDKEKTMDEKQLRHVVLIKFKENTSGKDMARVEKTFSALPDKISAIKDYEWGTNNSPEGLNKGFTHCFFVTFESEEDRSIYLPHPDHKAFVEVLEPHLEDVLVVDYWTKGSK